MGSFLSVTLPVFILSRLLFICLPLFFDSFLMCRTYPVIMRRKTATIEEYIEKQMEIDKMERN